jgi:hypothetical protein
VHCLVIPADLLERFELLTPGENDPTPPTPNRQEVPPGDDPNRHVVPPNRHVEVAQPADDDTPTGTTCLLPITTYLARDRAVSVVLAVAMLLAGCIALIAFGPLAVNVLLCVVVAALIWERASIFRRVDRGVGGHRQGARQLRRSH